jgi:hypothetical protein
MTVERRLVVGLDDIKGVCFECLNPKCGGRHTFAPDKISNIPAICPHCRETWLASRPTGHAVPAVSPYVSFTGAIVDIQALLKTEGISPPGFRILLEFEEPSR